jgi:hypothetical protein
LGQLILIHIQTRYQIRHHQYYKIYQIHLNVTVIHILSMTRGKYLCLLKWPVDHLSNGRKRKKMTWTFCLVLEVEAKIILMVYKDKIAFSLMPQHTHYFKETCNLKLEVSNLCLGMIINLMSHLSLSFKGIK